MFGRYRPAISLGAPSFCLMTKTTNHSLLDLSRFYWSLPFCLASLFTAAITYSWLSGSLLSRLFPVRNLSFRKGTSLHTWAQLLKQEGCNSPSSPVPPPKASSREARRLCKYFFYKLQKTLGLKKKLFCLLIEAARMKREDVTVQSPSSIPEAPSALADARGSVLAPWPLSLLGTQPCPQPRSSPIPPPGAHAAPPEEGWA